MPKSHDSHQGSDAVSQSPSSDAASQLSEANYLGNQRLKHSPSPHPAADRHLQFTGVSYEEFHGRESQLSGLLDVQPTASPEQPNLEGPLTTNIRPAKIDALVPGILEVYRDLDLGVDKKEARRIASMQIGRDAQAKKPTLETSFSGSGLYGEDDPGLHATVNPDQSRNSVNPVDLSDHPQETHYPFSLADLSKPGSQDDTPMISRKVKNFLQLHEDPYLGEPWDNPHASGLTERKSSLPSWESLSNLPESLGNTGSSMEENDSGQMPLASETASMKRFRSEVETLDLDNNPIIGALGLEFTDQGTLKEEHISILDKEIAKYPKIPEKKISEDDREKIKKMLQIRRCHYNALLQQTTDNSRRLKAEIDESQTKQRPYEGMQIDHQARQAGLEERKNEYQARVVSSIDSAREEVLNSDTYKQLENTEYPSDDQNTTLSMYKAFIDLTDNIKAEIEASNTNIDIEGEMSELYKNINKMPDDDLMYFIHIDTIISAFGIMKEMGGDLSHIQSCKEELKSLNAGKSECEQPLQELQRNLEGLENEQKASHREEKRIRQQLIDDEFTFQAYAGVPKPKRQKKQSGIEPLEEEIEAPGGIKSRSRREVVDTHTASLDSNALKQEVFDTKQLGHVKEHKKGGVETELSKYVEGLIEEIAGKRLSQLILEAKVPETDETFESWRKRKENAGKTKYIHSTLRRSIIKEITKTSYDSIKKAYKEKKAKTEEKGYESETPVIEYARKQKEKSLEKSRKDPIDAKIVPGTE